MNYKRFYWAGVAYETALQVGEGRFSAVRAAYTSYRVAEELEEAESFERLMVWAEKNISE
jgi:hypothetical protein